ncbi:hypothetical protein [Cellulomonas sp. PhB150]|uniref:hypothetical protein n=1 Tax=Cellulomonas sp. PhB150 TaxID=2485188 RepID=UPI000FB1405A|nr:hypothetical protein [Cellulomonas sp. PhB150]ROS31711.1 hypothetical protein EDF34_1374 [Cellulomonas sp. PhB150]
MRIRLSGRRATATAVALAGALVVTGAATAVAVSPEPTAELAHDNGVREYPWFDQGAAPQEESAPDEPAAQDEAAAEPEAQEVPAVPDEAVAPEQDTTAPTLTWEHTDAPTTRVEDRSVDVVWTFADDVTADGPAQTFVQLDDDAPELWASSTWSTDPDLDGLADGEHTVTVTASDEAGNWSAPLTYSWVQLPPAAAAPEVTLDEAPWADDADPVTGPSATFALFTHYDLGPEYAVETFYALDGAPAERVDEDGELTFDGLAAGRHTLSVYAVSDVDGSSAPLELTWVVTG